MNQNNSYKYDFSVPGCNLCEHNKGTLTQYCHGFKKRKNPKRFTSKDPKTKAPKWCPKRLPTSVIRVYRYKDEQSALFGSDDLQRSDGGKSMHDYAYPHYYVPAFEYPSEITAKSFYESTKEEPLEEIDSFKLQYGDVVEIDDGIKAFAFVYRGSYYFKPAYFDSAQLRGAAA